MEMKICSTQLADLSCLVYQKSTNTYAPYNKVTTVIVSLTRMLNHELGVYYDPPPARIGFDNFLPPGLDQGEDLHPVAAAGQQGKLERGSWIRHQFNIFLLRHQPFDVLMRCYFWYHCYDS